VQSLTGGIEGDYRRMLRASFQSFAAGAGVGLQGADHHLVLSRVAGFRPASKPQSGRRNTARSPGSQGGLTRTPEWKSRCTAMLQLAATDGIDGPYSQRTMCCEPGCQSRSNIQVLCGCPGAIPPPRHAARCHASSAADGRLVLLRHQQKRRHCSACRVTSLPH